MFEQKVVKYITTIVIGTLICVGFSQNLSAAVLDFETLLINNNSVNNQGNSYSEDGFTINERGRFQLGTFGSGESRFVDSTSLFSRTRNGRLTLTQDGGGAFSLFSIDLNELNRSSAASVTFFGRTSSNAIVNQTFVLDGIKSTFETFFFSLAFNDLTRVSWIQRQSFHQFDNIALNVSAVPLPPAVIAFITAMMGVGFLARRKRKLKLA